MLKRTDGALFRAAVTGRAGIKAAWVAANTLWHALQTGFDVCVIGIAVSVGAAYHSTVGGDVGIEDELGMTE